MTQTEQTKQEYASPSMRLETLAKFRRIAKCDDRSLVATYDVVANEALKTRDMVPTGPVPPKSEDSSG